MKPLFAAFAAVCLALVVVDTADAQRVVRTRTVSRGRVGFAGGNAAFVGVNPGFNNAAFTSSALVGVNPGVNVNIQRAGLLGLRRRNINVNVGGVGGAAFIAQPQAFIAQPQAFIAQPAIYNQGAAFTFRRGVSSAAFIAQPQAYTYQQQNFVAPFQAQPMAYTYPQQQNFVAPQQAFTAPSCQQAAFTAAPQAYTYQQPQVAQFQYYQPTPVQVAPEIAQPLAPQVVQQCPCQQQAAPFTAAPQIAQPAYSGCGNGGTAAFRSRLIR